MKIGQKVCLGLLLVTAIVFAGAYLFVAPSLTKAFGATQKSKAQSDLERASESISTEFKSIARQATDWGAWDDTYDFVQGRKPEYREVNLTQNLFDTTGLDLLFILDGKGNVVFGSIRQPDGKTTSEIVGVDLKSIALGDTSRPGPAVSLQEKRSGLQQINGFPMAAVLQPISNSARTAEPVGCIVMGRFLPPDAITEFSESVRVPFKLVENDRITDDDRRSIQTPQSFRPIVGVRSIEALQGESQYSVRSATNPDILRDGERATKELLTWMGIISIAAGLAAYLMVHFLLGSPLSRFAKAVETLGNESYIEYTALPTKRNDEIGTLARGFESGLQRLESLNTRLLLASREAGMADVAKEVLHNAGNVMNSLSISAHSIHALTMESKVEGYRRTLDLLSEHEQNLAWYLTEDPRGQTVLTYLEALTDMMERRDRNLQGEMESLRTSIEHLKQIIQSHNGLVRTTDVDTSIRISICVEEALSILAPAFERHGIQCDAQISEELVAKGDPITLVQVLTNLLTNAKEALSTPGLVDKSIRIYTNQLPGGGASIIVEDNGIGIPADKLVSIFDQGFSTKRHGTGIGLHYCANAAQTMGWTLTATSEGVHQGAQMILEIPAERIVRKAA